MNNRNRLFGLLLATVAVIPLTACGDDSAKTNTSAPQFASDEVEVQETLVTSVDECVSKGNDRDICEKAFSQAKEEFAKTAPRFTSQAECEAVMGEGACTVNQTTVINNGSNSGDSGSFWGPLFMGYMIGNVMSDIDNMNRNSYYNRGYAYSRPVYSDRYGRVYSGDYRTAKPLTTSTNGCSPYDRRCNERSGYSTTANNSARFANTTSTYRTTTSNVNVGKPPAQSALKPVDRTAEKRSTFTAPPAKQERINTAPQAAPRPSTFSNNTSNNRPSSPPPSSASSQKSSGGSWFGGSSSSSSRKSSGGFGGSGRSGGGSRGGGS